MQVSRPNTKVVPLMDTTSAEIYDETMEKKDDILYINAKYRTYLYVIDSSNNTAIVVNDGSKIIGEKININTKGDFAHGMYLKEKTEGNINNSTIKTENKYSVPRLTGA